MREVQDRNESPSAEWDVIARARQGDPCAFELLVERYRGLVHVIAYSRLGNRETAAELVQEVFLRVYLHLDRFDLARPLAPWISRITRNLAIQWGQARRSRSRLIDRRSLDQLSQAPPDPSLDPRRQAERSERHRHLAEAVVKLPPDLRETVLLRYVEDWTNAQIAEHFGVHPSTVGRRLEEALNRLKGELGPVLREAAPLFRGNPEERHRIVAAIGVVAAMSPAAKAALAARTADTLALAGAVPGAAVAAGGGAAGIGLGAGALALLLLLAVGGGIIWMRSNTAPAAPAAIVELWGSDTPATRGDNAPGPGGPRSRATPAAIPISPTCRRSPICSTRRATWPAGRRS
ncbi:MAG TPA: sigma-70 family RNA polymerase sigma factor [Candidatus Sumerlaeota bacterium]|nr:sigma-70 family RNA polymerase sigma factor [Candidatus Sumerlaeota bacterium]